MVSSGVPSAKLVTHVVVTQEGAQLLPGQFEMSTDHVQPPNENAVQRRAREGAQRSTRPSACNGLLDGRYR